MPHYHPESYRIEARIRQQDKLARAQQERQAQMARAGRSRPQSRTPSWPVRLHAAIAELVAAFTLRETESGQQPG